MNGVMAPMKSPEFDSEEIKDFLLKTDLKDFIKVSEVVELNDNSRLITNGQVLTGGVAVGSILKYTGKKIRNNILSSKPILICHSLKSLDISILDYVSGIITVIGDTTSHMVVRARALSIPVIRVNEVQLKEIQRVPEDQSVTIIADFDNATVYNGSIRIKADSKKEFLIRMARKTGPFRKIAILANIDDSVDARHAIDFGADGIGMWRTENFLIKIQHGDLLKKSLVDAIKGKSITQSHYLHMINKEFTSELKKILDIAKDTTVIIRLLDLPLVSMIGNKHNIPLPGSTVADISSQNPLLSTRGARLGIIYPAIADFQLQSIIGAVMQKIEEGNNSNICILIPFVMHHEEMRWYRNRLNQIAAKMNSVMKKKISTFKFGATIETPRSTIIAAQIAKYVDFFSFGTNDLTQYTWALDRDSSYASILDAYLRSDIIKGNPFEYLDTDGVGFLIKNGILVGRKTNPDLKIGISGEFGSNIDLVEYFNDLDINYISSSVAKIPLIALAYAQYNIVKSAK